MHLRAHNASGIDRDPRLTWVRRALSLALAAALLALAGRESTSSAAPRESGVPGQECACAAQAPAGVAAVRAVAVDSWTSLDGPDAEPPAPVATVVTRRAHGPAADLSSPQRASRTLGGYLATAPPLSRTA